MAYKFVDVEYAKSYMDRVASVPFQLPAIAFGSAFALNLLNLAFERDQIKVQLSLLAAYINLLACLSYYLAWQSMAPTVMDAYGRGFNLNRWVMWIHTTPAMIYLVSIISDFTRNQVRSCGERSTESAVPLPPWG